MFNSIETFRRSPGLFALYETILRALYEALWTSTTSPFEYLGESDRAGTIELGKQSDLLLVEENPLRDISAAAKVAGVLTRGRWIGKEEIDQRMQRIAASFKASGRAAGQTQ